MRRSSFALTALLALTLFGSAPAEAASDCVFVTSATTMALQGDCTTDHSFLVPDGWTLDGGGHRITAVGPFAGAVVRNAGAVAGVVDLTIQGAGITGCMGGASRLRGILFDGASGSISGNTVLDIHRGPNGCQEGNGIEVRNLDGATSVSVTVADNVVAGYQKNGITANGDVTVDVTGNVVTGAGPVPYIAQNGIQFGFGARGSASGNRVSGNFYSGEGWTATGLLLFDVRASDVRRSRNLFRGNQITVSMTTSQACPHLYGGFYEQYGLCD